MGGHMKHLLVAALKQVLSIKKALTKKEIPPKYRDLPMIARGNTSIILEKDPDTVIMLTRDEMKKDWLHFGLNISDNFQIEEEDFSRYEFKEFPIYAMEMPRLYKLSGDNIQKVNKEIKFWKKAWDDLGIWGRYGMGKNWQKSEILNELIEYYDTNDMEASYVRAVIDFLRNYNPDQFQFDIAKRQFAQDKDGNIILIDPIVSADLIKIMQQPSKPNW